MLAQPGFSPINSLADALVPCTTGTIAHGHPACFPPQHYSLSRHYIYFPEKDLFEAALVKYFRMKKINRRMFNIQSVGEAPWKTQRRRGKLPGGRMQRFFPKTISVTVGSWHRS